MSETIPWREIRAAAKRDVYLRLVVALRDNRGVRLSAKDVANLVLGDDAIATAAESYFDEDDRLLPEDFRHGRLTGGQQ